MVMIDSVSGGLNHWTDCLKQYFDKSSKYFVYDEQSARLMFANWDGYTSALVEVGILTARERATMYADLQRIFTRSYT